MLKRYLFFEKFSSRRPRAGYYGYVVEDNNQDNFFDGWLCWFESLNEMLINIESLPELFDETEIPYLSQRDRRGIKNAIRELCTEVRQGMSLSKGRLLKINRLIDPFELSLLWWGSAESLLTSKDWPGPELRDEYWENFVDYTEEEKSALSIDDKIPEAKQEDFFQFIDELRYY